MTNHGARLRELAGQLVRFGLVGAAGFAVDIVVFNALRLTLLAPENIETGPLIAKTVSTVLAIATNWVGNRFWTFADSRQANTVREASEFFIVSIAGMGFGIGSLWVSHYVLGFTSVLADNISSNVIGLALGAVFRFALYRWWVFSPKRAVAQHPVSDLARGAAGRAGDGSPVAQSAVRQGAASQSTDVSSRSTEPAA
ncbi:GtrA family protein [Paramicrobacterium agarici]|uniref:Putative flippase GtrA n=1 Tax=Paramicrobacterium agarici TaxID=630514 RepID=A0A2A9E150_9MICO|nr:GtrA family protein [Microbacterium agarici]PFG31919.1 putative flippase GtrA [Microbacterium agarici]